VCLGTAELTVWPWEHLALGYALYSVVRRVSTGERPGDTDTLVLAVATQIPDVVDKPLAWSLGLLPSGLSLGHSVFLGAPIWVGTLVVARWRNRVDLGQAFVVGYASHLLGDVVYFLLTNGRLSYEFLLWPLVSQPATEPTTVLVQLAALVASFREFLTTPRGQFYLLFEFAFLSGTVLLWTLDGFPGVGILDRVLAGPSEDVEERP